MLAFPAAAAASPASTSVAVTSSFVSSAHPGYANITSATSSAFHSRIISPSDQLVIDYMIVHFHLGHNSQQLVLFEFLAFVLLFFFTESAWGLVGDVVV